MSFVEFHVRLSAATAEEMKAIYLRLHRTELNEDAVNNAAVELMNAITVEVMADVRRSCEVWLSKDGLFTE
jgi:Cdc6-like AAA superfamily ATPase